MEVLGGNKDAHHCRLLITTWPDICTFQTKLALCGRLEVMVRLVFIQLRVLTDIIQYVVYHCTLLQLLNTVLLFFRTFKPNDVEITWFWKWKSWSTKTMGCWFQTCFVPLCRYLITTWLLFFWPHASSSSHQSLNFMVVRQVAHMRHQNAPKRLNHGRRSWKNRGVSRLGWTLVAKVWHHKKKWHKQRMKSVSVFSGFGYCSRGVGSSSVMYVRQAAHLRH